MFKNADIPVTNVVPSTGNKVTMGSDPSIQPAGWDSTPENITDSKVARNIVTALKSARPLSCDSVRGNEKKKQIIAVITLNAKLHNALFDRVFSSFAPTMQWRAVKSVRFGDNTVKI